MVVVVAMWRKKCKTCSTCRALPGWGGSMLKGPYFYGPRNAKLGVLFVTHAKKII